MALLTTLRFVTLEESHLPTILAIEAKANGSPWSESSFRNELNHPHGIFLVALLGGEVVGYGGVWLLVDEAHITTVAVDEAHRRQGIGRRLMVELLGRARDRGMECSTLEVRAGNQAAVDLYLDLGYVVAARRKGYYPDNREDALVLWLYDLKSWEPNPR